MRSFVAFLTLVAVAAGQSSGSSSPSQSFNLEPSQASTSIGDVQPSATETVSGPINTGQACASIAKIATNSDLQYPTVQADLAYACLKSVPIAKANASDTIDALQQLIQFQSTLSYLKDPPSSGWANPAVDLVAGLNDIKSKVNNGTYTNEYDFEVDIASLLVKAHDGHLSFDGMAFAGAFRWRRSSDIALISASQNGTAQPKVWALPDFNKTNAGFTPSAVSQINGKDAVQFLQGEANLTTYHDPDTTYNSMFFMQAAQNYGYFTNPRFYPGPTTNITFENGTTNQYMNGAFVLQTNVWKGISDPQSFYDTYIVPDPDGNNVQKRDPNSLPIHLDNPKDHFSQNAFSLQQGSVPAFYPQPFVQHSSSTVPLAGFFVNTDVGLVGVLVIQTFNTADVPGAKEFQSVVQQYIAQAKAKGVTKHVIDVRTNGGGKVLLGYDTFLQFFPSKKPQTQSRWRGHPASTLFGKSISSYTTITSQNAELFTSPFSNDAFLSTNLTKFNSWNDMYPPQTFHGDNFTALLKYNLSDPLETSNTQLALGITITGYNSRNNFTQDPFPAEDLIILSDGICASTCSIFLELMVQQAGVRTLSVGGRPQLGPMVAVGGTKGTLVLDYKYLQAVSGYVINNFATTQAQANDWATFVPNEFSINVADSSVNFEDNIRAGMESGGTPTQFINDTSSCRIWYEPNMYLNVTSLWNKAAKVAFGGSNNSLDQNSCVRGSATTRGQQTGSGQGGSSSGSGGGKKSIGSATPRFSLRAVIVCSLFVGLITMF